MRRVAVAHYENFPVASWLCPPALRPAVTAIYRYARTADDLADEGDAPREQRLADLAAYRADLLAAARGGAVTPRWSAVFDALRAAMQRHALPLEPLLQLLDAFEQDVHNPRYADRAALLDYCRRSANPIGRLLLHLYGIGDATSLRRSDAVCTALQLVNFWQDLSVDLPRGRCYVPLADARAHGVDDAMLAAHADPAPMRALVAALCDWAASTMADGAPLAVDLPGRIGWELRLVVHGGLRIVEKIGAIGHAARTQRVTIDAGDAPRLAWRALRMRHRPR